MFSSIWTLFDILRCLGNWLVNSSSLSDQSEWSTMLDSTIRSTAFSSSYREQKEGWMQAQPFSPTLELNGQNGFPLFLKGSKPWFHQPFMDYLIHYSVSLYRIWEEGRLNVGWYPFDILKLFFSSWKPSLSQQTRSWHTHIPAFYYLVKCYRINRLQLIYMTNYNVSKRKVTHENDQLLLRPYLVQGVGLH